MVKRPHCNSDTIEADSLSSAVQRVIVGSLLSNEETGEFFGVNYTAVSHIARKVKAQLNNDRDYVTEHDSFKSQIKM